MSISWNVMYLASLCDLLMVKWPFKRANRDLQLGNQKVTLNHQTYTFFCWKPPQTMVYVKEKSTKITMTNSPVSYGIQSLLKGSLLVKSFLTKNTSLFPRRLPKHRNPRMMSLGGQKTWRSCEVCERISRGEITSGKAMYLFAIYQMTLVVQIPCE